MIRKITVNAELSRSANSNAKEETLIPENGTIYCGKVYTFVNAATYAEAIEIAKIRDAVQKVVDRNKAEISKKLNQAEGEM